MITWSLEHDLSGICFVVAVYNCDLHFFCQLYGRVTLLSLTYLIEDATKELPWSQRFFLIFLHERDQEEAAKRRQRVAKATRRERKTSGYLGLESHFHADDRVRI